MATPSARHFLEKRFTARDADQCIIGAIGLTYAGDRRVLQTLINGLSIGDVWTQSATAEALGVLGDSAAIFALRKRLATATSPDLVEAIRASLCQLEG